MLDIYLKSTAYENNYILKHPIIFEISQDQAEKVLPEGKRKLSTNAVFLRQQDSDDLNIDFAHKHYRRTILQHLLYAVNKASTFIPALNAYSNFSTQDVAP